MTPRVQDAGASREEAGGGGPARFPRILKGRRRRLFARMIGNGVLQAAAAIALPFAILASANLPLGQAAALLGLLAGALILLRTVELADAERLGLDYVQEVRLALFDGLTSGVARSSHGVAMSRLMNDLSSLKNWVGLGIARSFVAALSFAGCAAAAATLSVHHAAVILAPALLIAAVAALLVLPLNRRVAEVRRVRGRLAALLGEALLSLSMLRAFEQVSRSRKRVRTASRALNGALGRRIRVAAALRALPEAMLPFAIVASIVLQLPLETESVGLVLLAGLSVGPARQALRALEYRAAFRVARDRLARGLGRPRRDDPPAEPEPPQREPVPGLEVHRGPVDRVWPALSAKAMPVTPMAPVLARSLRRNIDVSGRFRGDDESLAEIARFCGLLDEGFAPKGLDTRLSPDAAGLTESRRARLSLARALAFGAKALAINAPVLLVEGEGRALLRDLPDAFQVHAAVVAGDIDPALCAARPGRKSGGGDPAAPVARACACPP